MLVVRVLNNSLGGKLDLMSEYSDRPDNPTNNTPATQKAMPIIRVKYSFMILAGTPISDCQGPGNAPSSTKAMVVSLTNAVNLPIRLTEPSVGFVNWRSMGSGGGFHRVCTPFQLLRGHTSALAIPHHNWRGSCFVVARCAFFGTPSESAPRTGAADRPRNDADISRNCRCTTRSYDG
jgi:hypothetical protein